jgi:lycopene cyclase domain-containing protein
MSLYLVLDIGSLIIPFLFSFHPKLRFYEEWPFVIPAILSSGVFFLIWDIWFTQMGVWGFNEAYLSGSFLFNLPLEEWLFFFCIPYACLFTHHCLKILLADRLFPSSIWTKRIGLAIIIAFSISLLMFIDKNYTLLASVLALILTMYAVKEKSKEFRKFLMSYAVILLPFILINGVLTGHFTADPVVWYNDDENMGMRFFSIPWDDFIYNYALFLFPVLMAEQLKARFIRVLTAPV